MSAVQTGYQCTCILMVILAVTGVTHARLTADILTIQGSSEIDGFKNFQKARSHFYREVDGYKTKLDFKELNRRKRDTGHSTDEVILHIQTTDKQIELELHSARPILDGTSTIVFRQRDYVRTSHTEVPDCFYTGNVRNELRSVASIGLCDHLEGAFTENDITYWFESLESTTDDLQHEIIIGKREDRIKFEEGESGLTDVRNRMSKQIEDKEREQSSGDDNFDKSRSKRSTPTLTAETVVFVDEAYVAKLKNLGYTTETQMTNTLLVKLNGMQAEWSKSDVLGYDMHIEVKCIEFWETDPSWYTVSSTLENTLSSVCAGAQSQGTYTNYDTIHLFTGVDNPDVAGKAFTGKVCIEGLKCAVSAYTRATEFTIPAHEFGHVMNMSHDNDEGCPSPNDGLMGSKPTGWSACSVSSMAQLLSGSTANCLTTTDVSSLEVVSLQSLWPGMIYTDDEICEFKQGPGYRFRYYPAALGECSLYSCIQMNTSAANYGTMVNEFVPTDGRYCATEQVCWSYPSGNAYQCITWADTGLNTSLITVVAGGWSEWGSQTSCSRTCGTGVQYRQRLCNNPKPLNSPTCSGDEYELTLCNTDACPGDSSVESTLIQQRAGETCTSLLANGYISSSEYQSTGDKLNSNSLGQCEVKCDAQSGFTMPTFQRFGLMPDGTPCRSTTQTFAEQYNLPGTTGKSSHCVQGYCITTGCDGIPGQLRDRCGVCGGTNSTCSVVDGIYTDAISGDTKIYTLPTGAFNIFFYFDYSIVSMQRYFLEVWEGNNYIVSYAFNGDDDTTSNPPTHAGTQWNFYLDAQYLWALGPTTQDVDIYVTDFTGGSNTGITYGYSYEATNATTVTSGTTTTASSTTSTTTSTTLSQTTSTTSSTTTSTSSTSTTVTSGTGGGIATTVCSTTTCNTSDGCLSINCGKPVCENTFVPEGKCCKMCRPDCSNVQCVEPPCEEMNRFTPEGECCQRCKQDCSDVECTRPPCRKKKRFTPLGECCETCKPDCTNVTCPVPYCNSTYIPDGLCCEQCKEDCSKICCPQLKCKRQYTPRGKCCKKCQKDSVCRRRTETETIICGGSANFLCPAGTSCTAFPLDDVISGGSGVCCKDARSSCYYKGVIYQHREEFWDKSNKCKCRRGYIICE